MLTGKLQGMAGGHVLATDVSQGPTDKWPDSVSDALHGNNNSFAVYLTFIDFLVTATAAANGMIGVQPDYIGYGASKEYNRTFLAHLPYKQAFGVSYLAAQQYVASTTNGRSLLDNVATVTGFSEGGYSSILGSLALEQNGVKILSLHSGGGPIELNLQMGFGLCKSTLLCTEMASIISLIFSFILMTFS